jgi:hypothetical protein
MVGNLIELLLVGSAHPTNYCHAEFISASKTDPETILKQVQHMVQGDKTGN